MDAKKATNVRIVVRVQVKANRALLDPRKEPQSDGAGMIK